MQREKRRGKWSAGKGSKDPHGRDLQGNGCEEDRETGNATCLIRRSEGGTLS